MDAPLCPDGLGLVVTFSRVIPVPMGNMIHPLPLRSFSLPHPRLLRPSSISHLPRLLFLASSTPSPLLPLPSSSSTPFSSYFSLHALLLPFPPLSTPLLLPSFPCPVLLSSFLVPSFFSPPTLFPPSGSPLPHHPSSPSLFSPEQQSDRKGREGGCVIH